MAKDLKATGIGAEETIFGNTRILVVEDSKVQANDLEHKLRKNGAQVVIAENGVVAKSILQTTSFDLIISDVVMPEMDGYQLCTWAKAQDEISSTPFILLTSLTDPAEVIKGLACGADSFLTKPYDEAFLTRKIGYLLENFDLRNRQKSDELAVVLFGGTRHEIKAGKMQIIDLLFSTYENAVMKSTELSKVNKELTLAQAKLKMMNENLEKMVDQRTRQLADREVLYRSIFESASKLIISVDHNGLITDCNKRVETMLGYASEELIGRKISTIMVTLAEDRAGDNEPAVNQEEESSFECLFKKKFGRNVEAEVTRSIIKTRDMAHPLEVWIIEDISEKKTGERKLIDAREKAIEGLRRKSGYIADYSQTIRMHLTSMLGLTGILEKNELTSVQAKGIAAEVSSAGTSLLQFVTELNELERLHAGQLSLNEEKVSIKQLFEELRKRYSSIEGSGQVPLHFMSGSETEKQSIQLDFLRFLKIMEILLSYFIYLREEKELCLDWSFSGNWIDFILSASVPLPENESTESLFEPFHCLEEGNYPDPGSASSKLFIAQDLAKALGGTIKCSSTPQGGTEFTFYLPYKQEE